MKYAVITQGNWGYRYGFNGLLNGLDYHDNKLIDFHIICTSEVPEDYIEQAKNTFDFGVFFYSVEQFMEEYGAPQGGGNRWVMEFYKYKLPEKIADQYDAVLITDCDYMVGGQIENYLRAVVGTDLIMTSNNVMDPGAHLNGADLDTYRARIEHNDYFFPCMNSPFISDPKSEKNQALYDLIFDIGHSYGEDIVPFSRGIIESGRATDLIILPGVHWFTPGFGAAPIAKREFFGKRCYFILEEKMMMMHRHWWCRGEMENEIHTGTQEGTERRTFAWANVQLMLDECKLINTTWKLPLSWDVD